MNELLEILEALAGEESLTGRAVGAVLARQGWLVARRVPGVEFPRVWRKGSLLAGIEVEGDTARVRLAVTLWEREVDEEAGFDALDELHDRSAGEVRRIADELEAGPLRALTAFDGGGAAGGDWIARRMWVLGNRTLLVGAVQDDTELPVRVDAVVS